MTIMIYFYVLLLGWGAWNDRNSKKSWNKFLDANWR